VKFGSKFSETDTTTRTNGGGGGKWIKGFKEGETRIRFLQEFDDDPGWVIYYEHYNPAGSYFPCTGDRDTCPGCTSTNERMKSASRRVAVNALVGQYQDVYKIPIKLANRLKIRAERNGNTITDRDYVVTRVGMDKDTEYDVESGNAMPIDTSAYQMLDINAMLQAAFDENWPDFSAGQAPKREVSPPPVNVTEALKKTAPVVEEKPAPFEGPAGGPADQPEVEITLDQLHAMTPDQLRTLCENNGAHVPDDLATQQEIISWMETQFA